MNQSDQTTVHLGPSPGQIVQAFVWVVIGLLISAMFFWIALREEFILPALAIAVAIAAVSLASAVLEYRALPGVNLVIDTDRLTVHSRGREDVAVPLPELREVETIHRSPVKRRRARTDAMMPDRGARPSFASSGRGGWHLQVTRTDGEPAGPISGFPIGMDEQRSAALREACARHRISLRLGQ